MLLKKYTNITLLILSLLLVKGCGGDGGSSSEPEAINLAPIVNAPLSYSSNTNSSSLFLFSEQLLAGASDPEKQILSISNIKLRSGNDIGITLKTDPYQFIVEPYDYDNLLWLNDKSEEVIYDYTISDGNGGSVETSITFIFNGVKDGRRLDTLTFTDSTLQTCVDEEIDNSSLTFVYEFISLYCKNIESAQGIENLTALESLQLPEGQLASIDLSSNTALTYLDLNTNELASIDVYNNTRLRTLALRNNKLTSIDLSKNIELNYIGLNKNQLTEIDVTNNPKLDSLLVNVNFLKSLDISSNTELTQLGFSVNQLTVLDISQHSKLEIIIGDYNFLTEIDLSNKSKLNFLNISNNRLVNLDTNANSALETLILNANSLADVDLSNNVALQYLNLEYNKITELELSNNINLIELKLMDNQISTINLDNNKQLELVRISSNPLTQGAKDYLDAVKASGISIYY